jgi:hypothetical protein
MPCPGVARQVVPRPHALAADNRENSALSSSGDRVSDCYQADVPATALRVDSGKTYGQPAPPLRAGS